MFSPSHAEVRLSAEQAVELLLHALVALAAKFFQPYECAEYRMKSCFIEVFRLERENGFIWASVKVFIIRSAVTVF